MFVFGIPCVGEGIEFHGHGVNCGIYDGAIAEEAEVATFGIDRRTERRIIGREEEREAVGIVILVGVDEEGELGGEISQFSRLGIPQEQRFIVHYSADATHVGSILGE
ncbi:hypothetical protein MUK42_25640 [Musa troglodytarum]|uniref:Uncharacterized protein n=1 Tax=Musa troglodytarum TaxID=320322 RepID=A0A9E7L312_9LILI|nr:hypothetical protein MUK42_25640 [Musa troglodytarum]